jgi:voltage-gated potassium channel
MARSGGPFAFSINQPSFYRSGGNGVTIVESPPVKRSERIQQRFEWPVVAAALATIPILIVQESHLGQPWATIAGVLNWSAWLTFASEVVVMLWVSPRKRTWLRAHLVDVLVTVLTPPFAPAAWQAGRFFRVARLFRLVRAFSLRHLLSLDGIRYAALIAVGTVVLGGATVASIETNQQMTTWDGIWWAATTVTTVGYGDFEIETDAGRIIAMMIMLVGIGFVALLTAFIADRFIQGQKQTRAQEEEILAELHAIGARLANLESNATDAPGGIRTRAARLKRVPIAHSRPR